METPSYEGFTDYALLTLQRVVNIINTCSENEDGLDEGLYQIDALSRLANMLEINVEPLHRTGVHKIQEEIEIQRHNLLFLCQQARPKLDATIRIPQMLTGGRPRHDIPDEDLRMLTEEGFSQKKIAELLKVSLSTIKRRCVELKLCKKDIKTVITDQDLDHEIDSIRKSYAKVGYRMIWAQLSAKNIIVSRKRVRSSVHRVDSFGIAQRRSVLIPRRKYKVRAPNSLWHIDGNLKLCKYGFVIHGGMDGYSHVVVYLNCSINNKAETVFQSFCEEVRTYGVPSRVRSDRGTENLLVGEWMIRNCGPDRGSFITGKSVHNQRIERFWLDLRIHVLDKFKILFQTWKNEGLLDPKDMVHLLVLQHIFLPRIQKAVKEYQVTWNKHRMETEQGTYTPEQQWRIGSLTTGLDGHLATQNEVVDEMYGVEPALYSHDEEEDDRGIPETGNATLKRVLEANIDPCTDDGFEGKLLFMQAMNLLGSNCDAEYCTCDAWEPNESGNAYKCGSCGHYITRHKRLNEAPPVTQIATAGNAAPSPITTIVPQQPSTTPSNLMVRQQLFGNRVFPGAVHTRLVRGGSTNRHLSSGTNSPARSAASGLLASSLGLLPTVPTVGNRYQVLGKVPLQLQSKAQSSAQNARWAPKAIIEVNHALDVHLFPKRNSNIIPRGKKFSAAFSFMEEHDLMKIIQIVHPCNVQQVDAAIRDAFPILAGQNWNLLALDPSQPKSGRLGIVKLSQEEKLDSNTLLHYSLPPVQKSRSNRRRVYLAPADADIDTSEESDEDNAEDLPRKRAKPTELDDESESEEELLEDHSSVESDNGKETDELMSPTSEIFELDDRQHKAITGQVSLTDEVSEAHGNGTTEPGAFASGINPAHGSEKTERESIASGSTMGVNDSAKKLGEYNFPEDFVFQDWLKSPEKPNPEPKIPFDEFRKTFLADARRFYEVSTAEFVQIYVEETNPVVSLLAWYALATPANLLRNPQICFRTNNVPDDEGGVDLLGVYRECLAMAWDYLMDYSMPGIGKLFTGDQMKMPTSSPIMQNADIFVAIGKMVISCILHDACLPIYVEEYMYRSWMGFPLDSRILIQRNPYIAKMVAIFKYLAATSLDGQWNPSTIPGLNLWLDTHGIDVRTVLSIPAEEFANQIVHYELIGQYTQALSHLYSGMNQVNFIDRFREAGCWLECEDIYYTIVTTSDEFLEKLNQPKFTGTPDVELRARVFSWFVEYVMSCDTDKLRKLMRFITSMDRLGPRVNIEFLSATDVEPGTLSVRALRIHACAKQIDLCVSYAETEKTVFINDMDYALRLGGVGFGMQ